MVGRWCGRSRYVRRRALALLRLVLTRLVPASPSVSSRFGSRRAALVAPPLPPLLPSHLPPPTTSWRLQSRSMSPIASCSPNWPPGRITRPGAFVSTSSPLPSRPRPFPSCPAPLTTSWPSESTSTPLDASCSSGRPPGLVSRRSTFVSTTPVGRSWTLWTPPCTSVSPSGPSAATGAP